MHEWDDDGRDVAVSFAADPRRNRFPLRVSNPDRDHVMLGAGIILTLVQGRSIFLDFETPVGLQETENYSLTGGVRLSF